jgi:hypothetical protein
MKVEGETIQMFKTKKKRDPFDKVARAYKASKDPDKRMKNNAFQDAVDKMG